MTREEREVSGDKMTSKRSYLTTLALCALIIIALLSLRDVPLRMNRDVQMINMAKSIVGAEGIPKPIGPYSPAVKAGGFVFCAGQIGRNPVTGEIGTTIEEQTHQALVNLQRILESVGASLNDTVKTTVFVADMNEFSRMNTEYAKFFPRDPPARSTIGAVLPPGIKVEIELIAYVGTK